MSLFGEEQNGLEKANFAAAHVLHSHVAIFKNLAAGNSPVEKKNLWW